MNGVREDFGYRLDQQTFWQAVRGELDPQQAFLNRRAEVFGDVEQALKMAMVLNMFSREFPYGIDDSAVQSKEARDD
jgi:hypothetical protein